MNIEKVKIGFGTWQLGKDSYNATYAALEAGYRLIDTAYIYGNEKEVGLAINDWLKKTNFPRSELFVQTKLWTSFNTKALLGLETSLQNLGLNYLDSFLIHRPDLNFYTTLIAIENLQKALTTKQIHHLGVSNFDKDHLKIISDKLDFVPWTNQIEIHPYNIRDDRLNYARKTKLNVQAYSPLGRDLVNDPVVTEIAATHKVTSPVVLLAWSIAIGCVPIVRSSKATHIKDNFTALNLTLSAEEIATLTDLNCFKNVCPEIFPI